MKLAILIALLWLRTPVLHSIDMLDCALGRMADGLCPEDGGWGEWSSWGDCEGECGAVGRHLRTRNCSNPWPARNGADCDGDQLEVKSCNVPGCSYEEYQKLLAHDAVRLEQLASLKRYSGSESSLVAKCLSSNCDWEDVSQALPSEQTRFWNALICVKKNTGCPVAGDWSDWSPWTRCNARCGPGQQMRCRACCDPPPSSAAVTCRGDACQYQPCVGTECGTPLARGGEWGQWSEWSPCSAPCNFGLMRRIRICQNPARVAKKESSSLKDYSNDQDYETSDDYYNNVYDDDDDTEESVDMYDDSYYDTEASNGRVKRSIPYYDNNNDDEDDLLLTTSRFKRTIRKVGQPQQIEKTTDITPDQPSITRITVSSKNANVKFPENPLSPDDEDSNQACEEEINTQVTETPKKLKTNDSKLSYHIVLDGSEDDECDELYKNSSTAIPCRARTSSICVTALFHRANTPPGKLKCRPVSSRKTMKSNTPKNKVLSTSEGSGDINLNPSSSKVVASSLQILNSVKSDFTSAQTSLPTDENVIMSEATSPAEVTQSKTTVTKRKIVVTNTKTTSHPEVDIIFTEPFSISAVDNIKTVLSTEESVISTEPSITSAGKEIESTNITNYISLSSETQMPSQQSYFSTSTEKPSTLNLTTEGIASSKANDSSYALPKTTATVEKFFRIFHKKTLSPTFSHGNVQVPSTFEATSLPPISKVLQNSLQVVELNFSNNRPLSCDLSKKLVLPSFKDSFPAEGCSGQFEEIKPCNTHLCNADGGWSEWSSWSPCVPDCGLGWQTSVRSCTNPEPPSNGTQCSGDKTRRKSCYLQPCPVTLKSCKAVFATGDSVVKYDALQQHSSILLLYVRFRHFSPTGSVVARLPRGCGHEGSCDRVALSLYRSHVLVSVLQQKCHADFLTSQRLSVGEWHEILLTIVGEVVTLRLDDGVLVQKFNLSCRPSSPNYDTDMKVGGRRFVGEVDQLVVNFKNHVFQEKRGKRNSKSFNDESVAPSESSQVQYEVNSRDAPTTTLSHFLQAPCFGNYTSWNIDLALKPHFPDGLVLFIKGYDSRDFLFLSLEQTRVRLRVRTAGQSGECEHAVPVAPHTWLHLGLSRPPDGPVGLTVDGGPRCVVSLAPPSNGTETEEPAVYCTGGLLMGEMPLRVKEVLSSEPGHTEPIHSPLGLLGHLAVDNHSLDLTRLPRKIAPDLVTKHPDDRYRLASHTAAATVYYEEMLVLQGESLSMPCIYDLSPQNTTKTNSVEELDINWYKLDIPVKLLFSNESGVHFETPSTGKAISLNITKYSSAEAVEGFYSCWLHYPLPLQSGLNIVTYGVIIISTTQDKRTWLFWMLTAHLCLVMVLLLLLALWLVFEAHQDCKRGSGYYRCKKLKGDDAYRAIQSFILSDKAINRLGSVEAAERAFERFTEYLEQQAGTESQQDTDTKGETATDTDITTDNEESQSPASEERASVPRGSRGSATVEKFQSINDGNVYIPKSVNRQITVGVAGIEFKSPFIAEKQCTPPQYESRITIEELVESDCEGPGAKMKGFNNDGRRTAKKKPVKQLNDQTSKETFGAEIGQIQSTTAYQNIVQELKFKPEEFKNLAKNSVAYSRLNKNNI